jgi:hypothetical protein
MEYKIDRDIPLPLGRSERYPFSSMNIGESFFSEKMSARTASINYQKKHGGKFASRRENGGVRIWRIA